MSRKSVNKKIRDTQDKLDRARANSMKGRGGRPTVAHGSIEPPRSNSFRTINHGARVNPDDYIDYE